MPSGVESSARGPGRPRAFDEESVRIEAMHTFWTNGFDGTTIRDLTDATGLSASSLYAAFGSKEELFVVALELYLDVAGAISWRQLRDGQQGLEDLHIYFDRIQVLADERPRRGCLAARSGLEHGLPAGASALTAQYRSELDDAIQAAVGRSVARGELIAESAEAEMATARRVSALVIAYLTLVASPAPRGDALEILNQAREKVGL